MDCSQDVISALVRGELSRSEAAQLARLTADRLGVQPRAAVKIREEIASNHFRVKGSQTVLREKVHEALGEQTLVTTEKMTEAIQRIDDLLKVDPEDRRHFFYEQMKDFFFAMRDIEPEEIDDSTLDLLTQRRRFDGGHPFHSAETSAKGEENSEISNLKPRRRVFHSDSKPAKAAPLSQVFSLRILMIDSSIEYFSIETWLSRYIRTRQHADREIQFNYFYMSFTVF
jgi:hypothetical protein